MQQPLSTAHPSTGRVSHSRRPAKRPYAAMRSLVLARFVEDVDKPTYVRGPSGIRVTLAEELNKS